MAERDFDEWTSQLISTIADFSYYIDYGKVFKNVDSIADKLKILNKLIGSDDFRNDFLELDKSYPEIRECISILLAIRERKFQVMDEGEVITFNLSDYSSNTPEQLLELLEKTGISELISHRLTNIVDYVYGIEAGLDSNARKNRGGHMMEDLVEGFIKETDLTYYKEMYASEIEKKWGLDLSSIRNDGKSEKRFDFVVENGGQVFAFETNFYTSGGSKLNETARSYKMLAEESKTIDNFRFVWITDGKGWGSAIRNLRETFEVLDDLYCIKDLERGVLKKIMKDN